MTLPVKSGKERVWKMTFRALSVIRVLRMTLDSQVRRVWWRHSGEERVWKMTLGAL
jgi:hypothetical protein